VNSSASASGALHQHAAGKRHHASESRTPTWVNLMKNSPVRAAEGVLRSRFLAVPALFSSPSDVQRHTPGQKLEIRWVYTCVVEYWNARAFPALRAGLRRIADVRGEEWRSICGWTCCGRPRRRANAPERSAPSSGYAPAPRAHEERRLPGRRELAALGEPGAICGAGFASDGTMRVFAPLPVTVTSACRRMPSPSATSRLTARRVAVPRSRTTRTWPLSRNCAALRGFQSRAISRARALRPAPWGFSARAGRRRGVRKSPGA